MPSASWRASQGWLNHTATIGPVSSATRASTRFWRRLRIGRTLTLRTVTATVASSPTPSDATLRASRRSRWVCGRCSSRSPTVSMPSPAAAFAAGPVRRSGSVEPARPRQGAQRRPAEVVRGQLSRVCEARGDDSYDGVGTGRKAWEDRSMSSSPAVNRLALLAIERPGRRRADRSVHRRRRPEGQVQVPPEVGQLPLLAARPRRAPAGGIPRVPDAASRDLRRPARHDLPAADDRLHRCERERPDELGMHEQGHDGPERRRHPARPEDQGEGQEHPVQVRGEDPARLHAGPGGRAGRCGSRRRDACRPGADEELRLVDRLQQQEVRREGPAQVARRPLFGAEQPPPRGLAALVVVELDALRDRALDCVAAEGCAVARDAGDELAALRDRAQRL